MGGDGVLILEKLRTGYQLVDTPTVVVRVISGELLGTAADFDGDGVADLVYLMSSGIQAAWRRNDGLGNFGAEQPIGSAFFETLRAIGTADPDGNGLFDVVIAGDFSVAAFLAQPGGAFTGPIVIDAAAGGTELIVRDVVSNGQVDVLVSGAGALARVFPNLGGGVFGSPRLLPAGQPGSEVVVVADYDGDLDMDVLRKPSYGGFAWNTNRDRFGSAYCGPAQLNSTGSWAAMSASGSASVTANDLTLIAERLPVNSFGYFLVAPLDLTDVPTPLGPESLVPGDTRYFQAWFRDANPGVTSNFTSGLRISFE